VLAVNAENVVEERKVRLGVEDSARVEVLSGLSEGERVIIGNRSEYHNGQKIQPKDVTGGAAKNREVRADVWIFDTQPIFYHRGVPGRGDRGHGDAGAHAGGSFSADQHSRSGRGDFLFRNATTADRNEYHQSVRALVHAGERNRFTSNRGRCRA